MKIILLIVLIAIGISIQFFIIPSHNVTLLVLFSVLAGWFTCLLIFSIFGEPQLKAHREKISKWEKDMEGK